MSFFLLHPHLCLLPSPSPCTFEYLSSPRRNRFTSDTYSHPPPGHTLDTVYRAPPVRSSQIFLRLFIMCTVARASPHVCALYFTPLSMGYVFPASIKTYSAFLNDSWALVSNTLCLDGECEASFICVPRIFEQRVAVVNALKSGGIRFYALSFDTNTNISSLTPSNYR